MKISLVIYGYHFSAWRGEHSSTDILVCELAGRDAVGNEQIGNLFPQSSGHASLPPDERRELDEKDSRIDLRLDFIVEVFGLAWRSSLRMKRPLK